MKRVVPQGISRHDVTLPSGRVYGTAGAWGSLLGRKGNLTIRKRKLGWLPFLPAPSEASFLVGRFQTKAEGKLKESARDCDH